MQSFSVSRIRFICLQNTINLLYVSRIHYEYPIFFANSLWSSYFFSRTHYELTIYFANILRIHYPFREFTMNSLVISWFTEKSLSFSRIHFESISVSRIRYLFRENTMNFQSVSRLHYEFTIYFADSKWIHYPFREFTIHSLSILRI